MSEHGTPARGEAGEGRLDRREPQVVLVVADPGLEEVAEDVERACGARFRLDEGCEAPNRLRLARIEMQVRDEQRGHGGSRDY